MCFTYRSSYLFVDSFFISFGGHLSARGSPDPRWLLFWVCMILLLVSWTLAYFIVMPFFWPRFAEDRCFVGYYYPHTHIYMYG